MVLGRYHRGLRSAVDSQLSKDRLHIVLRCLLGDAELSGYLAVGASMTDLLQHPRFLVRQQRGKLSADFRALFRGEYPGHVEQPVLDRLGLAHGLAVADQQAPEVPQRGVELCGQFLDVLLRRVGASVRPGDRGSGEPARP
jgi:hypothetical protein